MDEIDAVPRPRRQRPKDSFQNELQAKLYQRKTQGLAADITDSDEDVLGSLRTDHYSGHARPGSAKRRSDHSPDLSRGLGTRTMGSKDLSRMLRDSANASDDEDEEIVAANFRKASPGGTWQPGGRKTPSPGVESKFMKQKASRESPKDQTGRLDSLFGKKTPTKEASPRSPLSKEDIIFGRKTPTYDGKKSPSDGSSKRLPGVDGDTWKPPNYRSVSPSSSAEHSRGSRGVTPVDASLDTISETPREKVTPRMQRGERKKIDTSPDNRPKPQARGKVGERKTPPLIEPRRTSPFSQKDQDSSMKRTTPTLDLFGRSRTAAAQEVDQYIGTDKDKRQDGRKTPDDRQAYGRAQTPEAKQRGSTLRDKTPERPGSGKYTKDDKQGSGKFMKDGKRTPVGQKTPNDPYGRKSPLDAKSPGPQGRKSPLDKKLSEEEAQKQPQGLLDFLMGDSDAKPKPQERGKRPRGKENQEVLDDIFGSSKSSGLSRNKSLDGHKSPGLGGRKTPEHLRKSPETVGQPDMFKTIPKQQKAEDTSSICDDIPPDPNRKVAREAERTNKQQTSERAQADGVIDTIATAQTMAYIEPAKKIRPVTASAKVQCRPKPRYGTLPGDTTKSLQERQFNSTGDIRDAIYEEWYKERLRSAKQKKREEERKAKEEEEKQKKAKEDKRLEAEASYRAWKEKKKEGILTDKEKKEAEEKKKKEEEEKEKEEKRVESVKSFESWKKKKDEMIKRELHKKDEAKRREEDDKKEQQRMKMKERETAFRGWQNKKEQEEIRQKREKKKQAERLKHTKEDEEYEREKKEEESMKRYLEWVEEKERKAKLEKKKAKRRMEEDEFKPAWSPASRTIPFGR